MDSWHYVLIGVGLIVAVIGGFFIFGGETTIFSVEEGEPTITEGDFIRGVDDPPPGFIGVGAIGPVLNYIDDPKEEVAMEWFRVGGDIVQIQLDDHPNSGTGAGYKWDMALCNITGDYLQYMEEDAQGGFDNSQWVDVNYGKLSDFGMNESWCGSGYAFILFNAGSKNQFPVNFRLNVSEVTNYTISAGTGSAVLIGSTNTQALKGVGENIVVDSNDVIHVVWEDGSSDIQYSNSSDNGVTWTSQLIQAGSYQEPGIIVDSNDVLHIFYSNGDIQYHNSSDNGATWTSQVTILDETPGCYKPHTTVDANDVLHMAVPCNSVPYTGLWYSNSSDWSIRYLIGGQSGSNEVNLGALEVGSDGEIYIAGYGSDQDDMDIWSSKDNFTQRFEVRNGGLVGINSQQDTFGIATDRKGNISLAFLDADDFWYCGSDVDNWNVSWTCTSPDGSTNQHIDIVRTFNGELHALAHDSTSAPNLIRHNSSDNGVTWNAREQIEGQQAWTPSVKGTNYPDANRIETDLQYVFSNNTGVYFNSYGVKFTSPAIDGHPPAFNSNSTNSTFSDQLIQHRLNVSENHTALAQYVFSFDNGTGTFVNDSNVDFTDTETEWVNVTKYVSQTVGATIRWMVYFNDTNGNMNVSATYSYLTTEASGKIMEWKSAIDGFVAGFVQRNGNTRFLGTLTVGNVTTPKNVTLFSGDGDEWSCGPDDDGTWGCVAG